MASLEERFFTFMNGLPSTENIDDLKLSISSGVQKADYLGLGRQIVFEQKCITQDQTQKIQDYLGQFQDEEWYPLFFGKRDINQILEYFPDPDEAKRIIISKSTKLIEDYFQKANRQIKSTKRIFNVPDAFGILVILNDSVNVLSPELLAHRTKDRLFQRGSGETRRFESIDMVLIISETHLFRNSNPAILQVDGPKKVTEKLAEYLKYLFIAWGQFNGGRIEFVESRDFNWQDFKEKQKIPNGPIKRHQARSQWYKENPYLRECADDEVFEFGAKVFEMTAPFLLKGGPKAPMDKTGEMTLAFGDFIEEINFRGLDMKKFYSFIDRDSIDKQLTGRKA